MSHNENLDRIEAIVDELDFCPFVELLAEICSAKADHVEVNWQDELLAEIWNRRAAYLLEMSNKIEESFA